MSNENGEFDYPRVKQPSRYVSYTEYRVMEHEDAGDTYYGIHEVDFDEEGEVINWSEEPLAAWMGDTPEDLHMLLEDFLEAVKAPVLCYDIGTEIEEIPEDETRPEPYEEWD